MHQLKDFTYRIVAGANIATIALMLLVGYSDRVDPSAHPYVAVMGLAFPVFLLLNAAFLVFWLCTRKRWSLIALAGFVVAYGPVSLYWPMSVQRDAPDGAIKVLTYNVFNFNGWDKDHPDSEILDYIVRQDADIVCLQEADAPGDWKQHKLDSLFAARYPYRDVTTHAETKGDAIMLMSKFPIVSHEPVAYASANNHSEAYRLAIGRDTVLFVACHLESTLLTPEIKQRFKTMVKGELARDSMKAESELLLTKLATACARRAPQARAVAEYVERHRGMPVILCGDFNDSPISYTRRTVAAPLTDCYAETGNGPGISYHYNGFYVRIDNMMCSAHFTPYRCTVDRTVSASDHYPVYCWLRLKGAAGGK